uniref:Ataxin 7 like 1 n=1 Tax=Laticauda laticaudata TaxID=8630 RepID=A0A8C5RIC8_LATLA
MTCGVLESRGWLLARWGRRRRKKTGKAARASGAGGGRQAVAAAAGGRGRRRRRRRLRRLRRRKKKEQLLRRRRRSGGASAAAAAAAAAAMAALERPVPSPEAFLGQPWAAWVREAAPPHSIDLEDSGKEGSSSGREVMRLNKEDMHLFGHYPAHDDFYLVVCNSCNQVIKPQVFQSHCAVESSLRSHDQKSDRVATVFMTVRRVM